MKIDNVLMDQLITNSLKMVMVIPSSPLLSFLIITYQFNMLSKSSIQQMREKLLGKGFIQSALKIRE